MKVLKIVMTLTFLILLTGCADAVNVGQCVQKDPSGFFQGLFHGFISLFTLGFSVIERTVTMYDPNSTRWYAAGFYVGFFLQAAGIISLCMPKGKRM